MKQLVEHDAGKFGPEVMSLGRRQLAAKTGPCELTFVDDQFAAPTLNGHAARIYRDWSGKEASPRHIALAIANSAIPERPAAMR
jgi:hypothetical protein